MIAIPHMPKDENQGNNQCVHPHMGDMVISYANGLHQIRNNMDILL